MPSLRMPSFLRPFLSPAYLLIGFMLCAAPAVHAALPKGDVYLGFSRLGNNAFYSDSGGLNGLEGAAHLKLKHFVGVEADVAHYGYGAPTTVPSITTYMVGPRVTVGALGIKFFAHALAGAQHASSSGQSGPISFSFTGNDFNYALGGGVDVPIIPYFAWRVNGDYIAGTQDPQSATKARISTGLVFRF